jgi:hypothetical protein
MAKDFIFINKTNDIYIQFICHNILKQFNMKHFLILLTIIGCGINTKAQTAEDSVKTTINNLFVAMKNSDTSLLKESFADNMVLQTIISDKEGHIKVITEQQAEFIQSIGSLGAGQADERIRFESIKIDGPLGAVWTPYQFYYKGQFSHCGVNSFQLVRLNGQWKIQYIIDTRRKKGCL